MMTSHGSFLDVLGDAMPFKPPGARFLTEWLRRRQNRRYSLFRAVNLRVRVYRRLLICAFVSALFFCHCQAIALSRPPQMTCAMSSEA